MYPDVSEMHTVGAAAEVPCSLRDVGDDGDERGYGDVLADEGAGFLVGELEVLVSCGDLENVP